MEVAVVLDLQAQNSLLLPSALIKDHIHLWMDPYLTRLQRESMNKTSWNSKSKASLFLISIWLKLETSLTYHHRQFCKNKLQLINSHPCQCSQATLQEAESPEFHLNPRWVPKLLQNHFHQMSVRSWVITKRKTMLKWAAMTIHKNQLWQAANKIKSAAKIVIDSKLW